MATKKLTDVVNSHKFSEEVIHRILKIRGEYVDCGRWSGLGAEQIVDDASPNEEIYFIETKTTPKRISTTNNLTINEGQIYQYLFKAGFLKNKLDIREGFVGNIERLNDEYLITTKSYK